MTQDGTIASPGPRRLPSRRLPSLDALRAFEAAARRLSFTEAASELHVRWCAPVSRRRISAPGGWCGCGRRQRPAYSYFFVCRPEALASAGVRIFRDWPLACCQPLVLAQSAAA